MIPHPIRLRHPWETETDAQGRAVYRRSFNRPTGLDPWERVSLEIDRVQVAGQISLNGTALGQIEPGTFFSADVTSLIAPSNEVSVVSDPNVARTSPPTSTSIYIADADAPPGSPVGEVRLVIRAAPTS